MAKFKFELIFYSDISGSPEMEAIEFEMADHKRIWINAEKSWFIESRTKSTNSTFSCRYQIGFLPSDDYIIFKYGGAQNFIKSIQKVCRLNIIDSKEREYFKDASLEKIVLLEEEKRYTGVFI